MFAFLVATAFAVVAAVVAGCVAALFYADAPAAAWFCAHVAAVFGFVVCLCCCLCCFFVLVLLLLVVFVLVLLPSAFCVNIFIRDCVSCVVGDCDLL